MAGGLFSRLKIWQAGETVTNTDLNNEFNNQIANMDASHASGYSANLAQMQMTENPGGVGTENLAQPISVADEIERLRYVVQRLIGSPQWYSSPPATLTTLNNSLSQAFVITPSRIISGVQSTNSSQPKFLRAATTGGIKLLGTATPFNAYIDGTLYTISSDISLSGLSSSFASGNTATLSDNFTNTQYSQSVKTFNITGPGSNITSAATKESIFKIVNGANTEYFMGTVNASATQIVGLSRGYLFDSTGVPSLPIALTTGHTITILRMTYVFLTTAGALVATYNPVVFGGPTPSGASTGDYWYDISASTWKTYNGTLWVQANAIFVGVCAQDGTSTVVSRSNEFYRQFNQVNDVNISAIANSTVSPNARSSGNISVYGSNVHYEEFSFVFDITANLVAGETEQPNTVYYLYISEIGTTFLTALSPILRKDLKGFYHPYETWRCIGSVWNDGSSNFNIYSLNRYRDYVSEVVFKTTEFFYVDASSGSGQFNFNLPSIYSVFNREFTFEKKDSSAVFAGIVTNGETIYGPLAPTSTFILFNQYDYITMYADEFSKTWQMRGRFRPRELLSGSSGSFTTTSTSAVAVTNLSVLITTNGNPVELEFTTGSIATALASGNNAGGTINLYRNGVQINSYTFYDMFGGSSSASTIRPASIIRYIDSVNAGAYTYSIQAFSGATGGSISITGVVMALRERQ